MNETHQPMIFTPEKDNDQAPKYDSRASHLDDSLEQIRQRYRHTDTILSKKREKSFGLSASEERESDELLPSHEPNKGEMVPEQDFRLPEIEMPPEREYSLDDIPDEMFDNQAEQDGVLIDESPHPHTPNEDEESELAQLFKRQQAEREAQQAQQALAEKQAAEAQIARQMAAEDAQRAHRVYLNYREREHNQRVEQGLIEEEQIGILMEEDWLEAQQALQIDGEVTHTLSLYPDENNPKQYHQHHLDFPHDVNDEIRPVIRVNVYNLPDLPSTRKIRVWSESELLGELERKLRPHLTQAVAGLVNHVVQRKLSNLSYDLQMMLNEETPRLVEDVLEHHMESILRDIKEGL